MIRFILPIIFVIVSVGLYFGYIETGFRAIEELRAEEARYDEALGQSRELQALRDQLLTKYNSFPTMDLGRLQKMLPDHVDNVQLVLDLDSIASTYGLQIRNVVITRETGQASGVIGASNRPYQSILLTFLVRASYEDFLLFLQDLETSLRLVDVVSVSFDESEELLYDFDVTIRTYWLE